MINKGVTQNFFTISSTAFKEDQDFNAESFPETIESDDGRYLVDAIPRSSDTREGLVYKAFDSRLERPVAIKIEKYHHSEDKVIRNTQALAKLRHPGIVEVIEIVFVNSGGEKYMGVVYEWLEGKILRNFRTKDDGTTIEIFEQIASTLDYIHSKGKVHGDIRPENILITTNTETKPRAVLIDWGLSNLSEKVREDTYPPFSSPNALTSGSTLDVTDDNYSYLMCIYHMLTRHTAFKLEHNRESQNYISIADDKRLIRRLGTAKVELLDQFFKDSFCGDQFRLTSAKGLLNEVLKIIA